MPQNFIECDREQACLMPPSLREWLPEDHVAWVVLDAFEEMDLDHFYADYRADGHGRAACEPSMMVALLLYAYATKQRSARAIERHCRQDIAYRVITANQVPDHATIARFVVRHEAALGELFGFGVNRGRKAPTFIEPTRSPSFGLAGGFPRQPQTEAGNRSVSPWPE